MLRRSINHNYAMLLVLLVVREGCHVQWMEKYAARILAACDVGESCFQIGEVSYSK